MKERQDNSQPDDRENGSLPERGDSRPDESEKKSGQQKGREHVTDVRAYVEGLKEFGGRIPMRDGKPNWTAIASACGFARGVFYTNEDARAVIEQALLEGDFGEEAENSVPGTRGDEMTTPETGRAAHTRRKLEGSERRVQQLEEQLATKNAECERLRGQVKELEERLSGFLAFEEVMATSGRRYIP